MEKVAQEKSFIDFDEAVEWMEHTIWDWRASGWMVDEGTVLRYINSGWQAFIQLKKVG